MEGGTTKEVLVYEQIRTDLLNHCFEPGCQMAERTLCERYGVSRSPVRCALRLLVKDGLLKTDSSGRIFLPRYTLEDILEIYDLIEVLQIYAVGIYMKSPRGAVTEKLSGILAQIEESARARDFPSRIQHDDDFHRCLIESAGSSRLSEMYENLLMQKKMFDFRPMNDAEHADITTDQHRRICEAMKSNDAEGAFAAIREHEKYAKKYYVDLLVLNRHDL